jgi:hypothetical protein
MYTKLFVCTNLGVILFALGFYLSGPVGGTIFLIIGVWEAWTLMNGIPKDTISEIIWDLTEQYPLIPMAFTAIFMASIAHGIILPSMKGLYLCSIIGFLYGHFFFQRNLPK